MNDKYKLLLGLINDVLAQDLLTAVPTLEEDGSQEWVEIATDLQRIAEPVTDRWEPVKCPCGDKVCKTYGLSVGQFYQGTGFDLKTAQKICELMNKEESKGR